MGEASSSTLERIHAAAQAEFLEKGYQGASLRNIVKTAGVTTGALYGYYDSKEALMPVTNMCSSRRSMSGTVLPMLRSTCV